MTKFFISIFLCTSIFAGQVQYFDIDPEQDQYFQISRVEVVENAMTKSSFSQEKFLSNDVIMQVDGIIALGKKIYKIVEAGKPVVNTNFNLGVSVIPFSNDGDNSRTFLQMENWSQPVAKSYTLTYSNGFGIDVVKLTYTVIYQYGGSFEGSGNYLTGINIHASNLEVSWGFDVEATTELSQITNHGSSLDRVAGATFSINYTVKSLLKEIRSTDTFHVMGNGKLLQL